MTAAEVQRVHAALESTNGDRALAAIKLNMLPRVLKQRIADCEQLRLRWQKPFRTCDEVPPPVSEAEAIHKPPPEPMEVLPPGVTEDEAKMVNSMIQEDALLKRGLAGLELTNEEQGLAVELAAFHGQHFVKSIHMIGAGVTRMSVKLQTQLKNLDKDLENVRKARATATKEELGGTNYEMDMLLRHYTNLTDQLRKMLEVANKSALIHAMIHYRMKGEDGKPKKPGYNHEHTANEG